jgi:hypothetical protein
MTGRALIEINAIPALRRRRLLASYGALMARTDPSQPLRIAGDASMRTMHRHARA